jgi:hypothetical protein
MPPTEFYGSGTIPKTGDTRRILLLKELQATNSGGGGGGGGGGIPIGNPGSFKAGVVNLGNNVSSGTVTGLALPGTPVSFQLTVKQPANGLVLVASTVSGSETSDGYQFSMNGHTDSASYKMAWLAAF